MAIRHPAPTNRRLLVFATAAALFLAGLYFSAETHHAIRVFPSTVSNLLGMNGDHRPTCSHMMAESEDKDVSAEKHKKKKKNKHGHDYDLVPDITLIGSIPDQYIPSPTNNRRLVIVGDIHGMDTALEKLLHEVQFDPERDHLVATGDMVNKGPDTPGVISRLMNLNASAARGNHEDRVIEAWRKYIKKRTVLSEGEGEVESEEEEGELETRSMHGKKQGRFLAVAKSLSGEQIDWLARLPVILTAEPLPMYMVHAGLVPGVKIEKQDPWAVMHMRTLRLPRSELRRSLETEPDAEQAPISQHADDEVPSDFTPESLIGKPLDGRQGVKWAVVWDQYQKHGVSHKKDRRTVVYGHDAKNGLHKGSYAIGLDSGCVGGGALTALLVESDGESETGFKTSIESISCKKL